MLRAGFIGFGRMGITHFSILNSHPEVRIEAVCDASATMLNILKSYVPVKTYTNAQEMLDSEKLDFVVVSTPSDSHGALVLDAVKRNLHVFAEKPFVLSIEEGEKILTQLHEKTVVNQVGYVNRFNEVFEGVKNLLEAGTIGEIKSFSSEMYAATVLKETKGSWRSSKKTGGGCLYEIGSHCIDLGVYLLGKPDRVAGSIMQSVYSRDVDDIVTSTLIYNGRFAGTVHVNWSDEAYRKPTNIIRIFGSKGKIVADKHAYRIYLKKDRPDLGFHSGWNTRYVTEFAKSVRFYLRGNEFTRQLDYFVENILSGAKNNRSSFSEAMKTDIVMDEIIRDSSALSSSTFANSTQQAVPTTAHKKKSLFQKIIS